MTDGREKIKEFWEEKTAGISSKIEKTPMEKFFIFFLILITIAAVVLGYLQFKKNIEEPLYSSYLREKRGQLREKYSVENLNNFNQATEISKLQGQDSDLDGLDDYSEIYLYKTSAYLEDSDGDGIWDKQEILAGSDPNCPVGQECQSQILSTQEAARFGAQLNLNQSASLEAGTSVDDLLEIEKKLLSGETTLQELGVENSDLQQAFDQLASGQYQDVSNLSPEEKAAALANLKNLTPSQIREELIKQGTDKSFLDQLDDQTLLNLFSQILSQY